MLAAKAALACRADALFESLEANNKDKDVKFDPEWIEKRDRINKGELGLEGRVQVETRIRILEGGHSLQVIFIDLLFLGVLAKRAPLVI